MLVSISMYHEIDLDLNGQEYLKLVENEKGGSQRALYSYYHVQTNLIMYYIQIALNLTITILVFCKFSCLTERNNQRNVCRYRKLSVHALTTLSALLNLCIIAEIVFLWLFVHDEQMIGLLEN